MVVLLLLAGGVGVINVRLKSQKLDSAYETIRIGDTRERLVELSGQPPVISHSGDVYRPWPLPRGAEDYRYAYLYTNYYYAFDRDGRLTQKIHCFFGDYCNKVGG